MTNLVPNGGFDGNLYRWTGTGTIELEAGYPRLGCASLAAGQSISSEAISLSENQLYTLHYFYRLAMGASLNTFGGTISQQHSGMPVGVWREGVFAFAPLSGLTTGILFAASAGAAHVDSVTLLVGGLAIDRATLTSMIAASLRSLVTEVGLSGTPSAQGPNGDYTLAIDEALRAVGAINQWGDPDITALLPSQINQVVTSARAVMLGAVRADFALRTDVQLGPRRESYSQTAASIDAMLGGGGGGGAGGGAAGGRVSSATLKHGEWLR